MSHYIYIPRPNHSARHVGCVSAEYHLANDLPDANLEKFSIASIQEWMDDKVHEAAWDSRKHNWCTMELMDDHDK